MIFQESLLFLFISGLKYFFNTLCICQNLPMLVLVILFRTLLALKLLVYET